MPLITDDPAANANTHSWEMHDLHSSSEDGEIPWVLSGPSPEALAAGLVDHLVEGNTEAVIARAQALGESVSHLATQGAWGVIKVWMEVHMLWAVAKTRW